MADIEDALARAVDKRCDELLREAFFGTHTARDEPPRVLTVDKLQRINRVRLRYLAGVAVPQSDLDALDASAEEVLGLYYDPKRPPVVHDDRWASMRFNLFSNIAAV